MNAIERLLASVRRRLPGADAELIRPRDPAGRWTLDVEYDGWVAAVVWVPRRGFGLTARPLDEEPAYGENPDQVHPEGAAAVADQVVHLLRKRQRTAPPRAVALRELRARYGLSQADLAGRLSVQQGTISKLERREGLEVTKLAELVQAMGGELELWVRFPDEPPLRLLTPGARPARRRRRRG